MIWRAIHSAVGMAVTLIEAIVLAPEDGGLRIDVRGELAGILALSAEGCKSPDERVADAEQIKLVAGIGFDRSA